jgi:hypothetical protein
MLVDGIVRSLTSETVFDLEQRAVPGGELAGDIIAAKGVISIDSLYPTQEGVSAELRTALRLLGLAGDRLDEALELSAAADSIGADDSVQRLAALLPELFCCRSLGDGFGGVINGIQCAWINQDGSALTRQQLEKVRWVIRRLREEPFIAELKALELLQELERAGLNVEPPGMEVLTDWLDGESVR